MRRHYNRGNPSCRWEWHPHSCNYNVAKSGKKKTSQKPLENRLLHQFTRKKDRFICDNYRGIRLLPQWIVSRTDEILTEAQAEFRITLRRPAIHQLFTLRRMSELYTKYGKYLYVCYVEFQNIFDSVWRARLWHIRRHRGYGEKIIWKLYISIPWVLLELMVVSLTGSKTCRYPPMIHLSITPFNLQLDVVMALAVSDADDLEALIPGCRIFNLRFANDIGILVEGVDDLQSLISLINLTSERFGLRVSITKIEIQLIAEEKRQLQLHLRNSPLVHVEDFTYLVGILQNLTRISGEVLA